MGDAEEVSVRFRHTLGDIGPFQLATSSSVQSVKDIVFQGWPTGVLWCNLHDFQLEFELAWESRDMVRHCGTVTPHANSCSLGIVRLRSPAVPHIVLNHITHDLPVSTDGPLSKECPSSASDLRILCSGQFLENAKTLKGMCCIQRRKVPEPVDCCFRCRPPIPACEQSTCEPCDGQYCCEGLGCC